MNISRRNLNKSVAILAAGINFPVAIAKASPDPCPDMPRMKVIKATRLTAAAEQGKVIRLIFGYPIIDFYQNNQQIGMLSIVIRDTDIVKETGKPSRFEFKGNAEISADAYADSIHPDGSGWIFTESENIKFPAYSDEENEYLSPFGMDFDLDNGFRLTGAELDNSAKEFVDLINSKWKKRNLIGMGKSE